jgi:hypothetical protein
LRFVEAIFSSSFSLIEEAIDFDAPFSLLLGVSPRFADKAAPAAFCWAADLAGMMISLADAREKRSSSRNVRDLDQNAMLRVISQVLPVRCQTVRYRPPDWCTVVPRFTVIIADPHS